MPYRPRSVGMPFEVFTLQSLLERRGIDELSALQRVEFDLVIICTAGRGRHEVDLIETPLDPQQILHVRPGQVHRWQLEPMYEALLILLGPIGQQREWRPGPNTRRLTADQLDDLQPVLDLAMHERQSDLYSVRTLGIIRELVVSCLGLDVDPNISKTTTAALYDDFRRLIESDEHRGRPVEHFARELGCSTRSLARTCRAEAASSPKQLIDRSTCLAAQRLLSLPGATVTNVAAALGFDELSNFTRFFRRVAGLAPSTWLEQFRAGQQSTLGAGSGDLGR